jgi:predicted amidohydrolase YtcJ
MIRIRDAEVDGRRVDVRIADGRVAEIGLRLGRRTGEHVLDAGGGALLPGLVDHHLHLHALAAAARSTPCGPPEVRDPAGLAAALAAATTDEHGWVRGVGYHDSVAGHLDAAALDRLHAARPVRLQHRSGALWVVNAAGAERLGLADPAHPGIERMPDGTPTGRLWRADDWMRSRLPGTGPPDLTAVGARLSRLGITAVTDATPDLEPAAIDALAAAVATGALPQRVHLLGVPLGVVPPAPLTAGPYKIVLADSGLPDLDALTATIRAAHGAGRPVAVHCVTREALVLLLAALHDAGCVAGDRIEHAALVPADLVGDLAHRGLRVVTQPGFLTHRGDDYLRDLPAMDHPDLYRCRSLLDAGVRLALSSDAPYGPLDPWAVIAAAAHRRTPSGAVAGRAERLAPADALAAYLAPPDDPGGPPRRVRPGATADLALLDRPLESVLTDRTDPAAAPVRATLIAGCAQVPASGTSVG